MSRLDIDNACSISAGEAVGTTSLAAASCNLGHLDNIANSESLSDVNRVGVTRDTVAGFQSKVDLALREAEQSFGFVVAGTFSAGYTITNYNQLGQDASGDNWRYRGATLPFTVVPGTIPALPDFEEIEFSAASGITYRTGTVKDALDDLNAGAGAIDALNTPYIFAALSDLVSSNIVFPPGKKLVTIANNTDTNAGGTDYEVLTIAQYQLKSNLALPDGELNAGILIGSDFYLNSGTALVARRIQENNDINVYEFGYRGIGVIDNGPTVIATPDPTKDESNVLDKIYAYIERGASLDIGASSGGVDEYIQKGRYNVVFPSRSICNISRPFPYFPNRCNLYFNNTQVRPFSPFVVLSQFSFNAEITQLEIDYEVFNTDEEIYEAHLAGTDANGIEIMEFGHPDIAFPLESFTRYSQIFITGGWSGIKGAREGILFGMSFDDCNITNPLSYGIDIGENDQITTTCTMERPFVRLTKRSTVQHSGYVWRALQHQGAGEPQEPPAVPVSSEYWQIGLNSDGTPESPSGQDAWASGTFYRAFGKHYKLTNVSTLSMINPSADGGTDQSPTFEYSGINLNIDHFHLEKHQKVFSDRPTFAVISGALTFGTLYLAECVTTNEGNSTVQVGGLAFSCRVTHTSSTDNEPLNGPNWFDYWDKIGVATSEAAWVDATDYKTGDATYIKTINAGGRGITIDNLEQKGPNNKSGRIVAVDGENTLPGRLITGKGISRSLMKNMGGMVSLRGIVTPITNVEPLISLVSMFNTRPRPEQSGTLFTTSLVDTGVLTAEIDGALPVGTRFGFLVSNTASGTAEPAGTVALSGTNGAFFTGPSSVQDGTIWVEKVGSATDGSPNSWRTWTEGEPASGDAWVEFIPQGSHSSGTFALPSGKALNDVKEIRVSCARGSARKTTHYSIEEGGVGSDNVFNNSPSYSSSNMVSLTFGGGTDTTGVISRTGSAILLGASVIFS